MLNTPECSEEPLPLPLSLSLPLPLPHLAGCWWVLPRPWLFLGSRRIALEASSLAR